MNTAIIIGASTGIGRATALALSSKYENIAITSCHHPDKLDDLSKELNLRGVNCFAKAGNAGDYEFMKNFIAETVSRFGSSIKLLINNAAISYVGLITDMSISDWEETMNTNVTSLFNSCRQVVPYMVHEKKGHIINISSVWGLYGASCEVAYSASKGAVNAFTKALAKELAPSNISVNAIAFGMVDTAMNGHLSPEEKAALIDEIPAGRMATDAEAAEFILKISQMDNYLTGQIITYDGGWQ